MSKLAGLHAIFRKISIYGLLSGFHASTLAWSLGRFENLRATDLVVIEGTMISQSYMDGLLMPVFLHFAVPEPMPVLVRPRMTMPEYISHNQQTLSEQR